jgi:hypothetical protein
MIEELLAAGREQLPDYLLGLAVSLHQFQCHNTIIDRAKAVL